MLDYVTVMPGENFRKRYIENEYYGRAGSKIIQGLIIEENVVLGAGAVVTKNLPQIVYTLGFPQRGIRIWAP